MMCLCEQQETYELKVEGDVGADPLWCNQCGCNLELDDVPISNELKEKLRQWAAKYGEWIDWELDQIIKNGVELEEEHNRQGAHLTEGVKIELSGKYRVLFSPSSMGRTYAQTERL
jgi:plasmid stability protein